MSCCTCTFWLLGAFLTSLAAGDDTGLPPRATPSDYPVHDNVKTAVLAAAIVPPAQVKKIFSTDIGKRFIVVEVAVYPEPGHNFDIDLFDFALRTGDQLLHAAKPGDMATPWQDKGGQPGNRGPTITTESGVVVNRETDPITGRPRTSVGTYEGVSASNYPPPNNPAPPPDPGAIQAKTRDMALPEGATRIPVAGFLYFRQSGSKRDSLTLSYSTDDVSIDLKLPK
jgi:hypothetical protein